MLTSKWCMLYYCDNWLHPPKFGNFGCEPSPWTAMTFRCNQWFEQVLLIVLHLPFHFQVEIFACNIFTVHLILLLCKYSLSSAKIFRLYPKVYFVRTDNTFNATLVIFMHKVDTDEIQLLLWKEFWNQLLVQMKSGIFKKCMIFCN